MSEWNARGLLQALVRSWWVLVGVALVAGAIAYVVVGTEEVAWVGDAAVEIDTATVSKYEALPVPEKLLAELQSSEFRERVFKEAGTTEGQLSVYTTGNPQTQLHVRYVGPSEEMARKVADTAARAAVEQYLEMSEPERTRTELDLAAVREMERVLKDAVDDPTLTSHQRIDVQYRIFSLRSVIINSEVLLEEQGSAYSYTGEPVVTLQEQGGRQRSSALAAALIGLAFAVLAVVWRERPRTTPQAK